MVLNKNQIEINKGYAEIAKALGSSFGVYRPTDYTFAPLRDPRNWIMDLDFSASKSESFQSNATMGINQYKAYVDQRLLKPGDVFFDGESTYYIGETRPFEMAVAIQCFNCFSAFTSTWDKTTRKFINTILANEIPCNLQQDGVERYDQEMNSYSNKDSILKWKIYTTLPQGLIKLSDLIELDIGKKARVTNIFKGEQGLEISVTEVRENEE